MELEALRRLIRTKLADGRLPLNSLPNVCGGPGNGESCDACEDIVTKDELVMEELSPANGKGSIQLHVRCFWMWETERRPLASRESTSSPVTASAF